MSQKDRVRIRTHKYDDLIAGVVCVGLMMGFTVILTIVSKDNTTILRNFALSIIVGFFGLLTYFFLWRVSDKTVELTNALSQILTDVVNIKNSRDARGRLSVEINNAITKLIGNVGNILALSAEKATGFEAFKFEIGQLARVSSNLAKVAMSTSLSITPELLRSADATLSGLSTQIVEDEQQMLARVQADMELMEAYYDASKNAGDLVQQLQQILKS